MQRVAIDVAMHGYRPNAQPIEGPDYWRDSNVQILINRSSLFRLRARMGWSRSGNALHGTARLRARGDLPFTLPRKQRRLSALVFSEGAASNFYAKSLALQFEIRESVLGNEVDQFPELVHIDRSI